MSSDEEVQAQRERLKGKSRSELIHETRRSRPHGPAVIAAEQLLAEMDEADENRRHEESAARSKFSNAVAVVALIVAVAALVVAYLAWKHPH